MSQRQVLDVSPLPKFAFGMQGLISWGTAGFMVIEGSMFAMAIVVYFYLRLKVAAWPPGAGDPALAFGTANLLLAIVTCIPNGLAARAARRFDLRAVRVWMILLTLGNLATVGVRGFEYTALNCRWDDNAYGSIVWLLLSLHTIHIATDAVESGVLTVLAFTGPMTERRFVDVAEDALYWYFIVAWWIAVYLVIYWAPRWL
jgi:heme/copper-type cytochrome/quinol oxidase subunit 3